MTSSITAISEGSGADQDARIAQLIAALVSNVTVGSASEGARA
jgi:hypothetical protein